MGSAGNPISATTQQLEKGVAQKADVSGNATFTFSSPPAGSSWTGTLTCGNAPISAVFTATVGGTTWGSWGGNSVFGPIQVQGQGSQQLVVTAVGLAANSTYEVWMLGSSDQTVNVAPIWPDSTSSALTAQINGSVTLNTASTVIAQGGAVGPTTVFTTIYNTPLTATYTSFAVIVGGDTSLKAVTVNLANGTTGQSLSLQSAPVGMISGGSLPSTNNTFYFPVSVAAGQTLVVSWKAQVATGGDVYTIIGFPAYPSTFVQSAPNTMLSTRDGGGLLGAATPSPQLHGVFYTLLAAAPNGYCYRLWRFGARSTFTPATGAFELSDSVQPIATMSFPSGPPNTVNADSIALNGALSVGPVTSYWLNGVASSTGGSFLRYDTIPIPSFSGYQ